MLLHCKRQGNIGHFKSNLLPKITCCPGINGVLRFPIEEGEKRRLHRIHDLIPIVACILPFRYARPPIRVRVARDRMRREVRLEALGESGMIEESPSQLRLRLGQPHNVDEELGGVHFGVPEGGHEVARVDGEVLGRKEVVLHHVEADGSALVRVVQLACVACERGVADEGSDALSGVAAVGRSLGRILLLDCRTSGSQLRFGHEPVYERCEIGGLFDEARDETVAFVCDVRYNKGVERFPVIA